MRRIVELFEISRKTNNHPMEGLRGIAVFLVFMVHYVSNASPWTDPDLKSIAAAIHTVGSTGVDLFFVLSGYLIYGSLIANARPFWSFMMHRLRRIYPAFMIVLAVYIALSYLFPSESRIPNEPWMALLYLTQNALLLPGIFAIEPIITVAWSLSYEMAFYLTVPLLVDWMALRKCPQQTRGAVIAIAAACCLVVLDGEYQRIAMFCAGMGIYELNKSRWRAPPVALVLLAFCLGVAAMLLPLPTEVRRVSLFIGAGLTCWHATARPSWLGTALSWSPLRWYGNMSYSYYLIHGLALKLVFVVVGVLAPSRHDLAIVLLLPAFVATLIPAAILYLAVERPLSLLPVDSFRFKGKSDAVIASAAPSTTRSGAAAE